MVVSSLTGIKRGGVQDRTGAGPRTTSGDTGPTAKASRPRGFAGLARLEPGQRTVEPAAVDGAGLGQAAFQHVLPVKVGAVPIRRRDGVHQGGFPGLVETVDVRHGGIERKEAVERQRRRLAVEPQRIVAAQLDPIGIADRGDGGEPVERAAQHDGQETRVTALRPRRPRHERPGEQHARAEQQLAAGRDMTGGALRHALGMIVSIICAEIPAPSAGTPAPVACSPPAPP